MGTGRLSMSPLGRRVPLGQDIYAPSEIRHTYTDMGDGLPDVALSLGLEGRRYVVTSLTFDRARDGGLPITSELIRRIPVQRMVNEAVGWAVELWMDGKIREVVMPEELRASLVNQGPTDETLTWVARIYIMAEAAGLKPAQSVKESLKIPISTAGYWIRRAKDRGFMELPLVTTAEPLSEVEQRAYLQGIRDRHAREQAEALTGERDKPRRSRRG